MKNKDLRREQVALLRLEKALETVCREKASGKPLNKAPVIAGLSAVTAAAVSTAEKLGDSSPLQYAAEIEQAAMAANGGEVWLLNLAEVVTKSHNAIEALAQQGAFSLLEARGTPKLESMEIVSSLLTNGPF